MDMLECLSDILSNVSKDIHGEVNSKINDEGWSYSRIILYLLNIDTAHVIRKLNKRERKKEHISKTCQDSDILGKARALAVFSYLR